MNPIEVHRGSVQTWECDQMGHMNVQFYVQKAEEAQDALALALGLGPSERRLHGHGLVTVEHHIRYHRELRAGAPFALTARVIEVREHSLRACDEMTNIASGEIAATIVADGAFMDLATRKHRALPLAVREAALSMKADLPEAARPRGLTLAAPRSEAHRSHAEDMGMIRTYTGSVAARECDAYGYLEARGYLGRISDALPTLLAATAGHDRSSGSRIGGAALEYRLVYRKAVQAGDVLGIWSGLKSIGAKAYVWGHWIVDLETGDAVVTSEAVAIALDLVERRAVPLPDALRETLEARIVAGIGV